MFFSTAAKRFAIALVAFAMFSAHASAEFVQYAPPQPQTFQQAPDLPADAETAAVPEADAQGEVRELSIGARRSLLRLAIKGRIEKLGRRDNSERIFLNRFLADDDLLTIANEMADAEDPPVVTDPKEPFGTRIQWLIDHMDEIIAMIKKIMALFEGLNPPVAVWEPMSDGYVMHAWRDAGSVRFELLRRAA